MASERDEVLSAVVEPQGQHPAKLEAAILEGSSEAERTKRQQLAQKHEMDMRHAELGWFGRVFGSEVHAPIVIAFVVTAVRLEVE